MSATSSTSLALKQNSITDVLTNWSGVNVLGAKALVQRPASLEELSLLVSKHQHVRPIGSCLSYEPIAQAQTLQSSDSVLVDLQAFNGLRSYCKETHLATFGAATTIEQVVDTLETYGRAISCSPGVIGIQTLAGAIGTGTHGQGMFQNSISETVVGVEIVLADGSIQQFNEHDEEMSALRINMGLCGILTAITIRTSPLRIFTLKKHDLTFDAFNDSFEEANHKFEFCKAWWFPNSHIVHVWMADEANDVEITAYTDNKKQLTPVPAALELSIPRSAQTSLLEASVRDMASKMEHDTGDKARSGRQFETVNRFNDGIHRIGTLRQLYMRGIPVPQINCELALPLLQFRPAVAALMKWCKGTHHELHYPFIFRVTGPGSSYLTAHPGQPIVWIGVLVYLAADGSAKQGSFEMMREIQEVLAPLGGMPHWGKHFKPEIYQDIWSSNIPGFNKFRETVTRLDPTGKWHNSFTQQVFSLDISSSTLSTLAPACETTVTRLSMPLLRKPLLAKL